MTKNQRNYLADLAGRKGVRLQDTDNWSVAHASEEIERLKAMPDAIFNDPTDDEIKEVNMLINNVQEEIAKWNLA